MPVNRNGNNFISCLMSLGLKIVNGRLGTDKYLGEPTCFKSSEASVIDYLVVCHEMLPFISDFKVDMFDRCMSDVHAPIQYRIEAFSMNNVSDNNNRSDLDSIPKQSYKNGCIGCRLNLKIG